MRLDMPVSQTHIAFKGRLLYIRLHLRSYSQISSHAESLFLEWQKFEVCKDYEHVPLIDAAATMGDDGSVTVFCVNRDLTEEFELAVDLHAFGRLRLAEHILLHHDDVKAVNTEESPNTIAPVSGPGGVVDGENAQIRIPALSWNVLRFERI